MSVYRILIQCRMFIIKLTRVPPTLQKSQIRRTYDFVNLREITRKFSSIFTSYVNFNLYKLQDDKGFSCLWWLERHKNKILQWIYFRNLKEFGTAFYGYVNGKVSMPYPLSLSLVPPRKDLLWQWLIQISGMYRKCWKDPLSCNYTISEGFRQEIHLQATFFLPLILPCIHRS